MKYGLLIGKNTAEKVKINMGGVIRGRDLENNLIFINELLINRKVIRIRFTACTSLLPGAYPRANPTNNMSLEIK